MITSVNYYENGSMIKGCLFETPNALVHAYMLTYVVSDYLD